MRTTWIWLILAVSLAATLTAQNEYVRIDGIEISGNRRTQVSTILRELDFELGDTLPTATLMERLRHNEQLLMNVDLFNAATFNIRDWQEGRVRLTLEVVEDWYFFPLPVVDFADRNFNVWWVEQNRALNRINLGLYLIHTNFTGRRDYLKAVGQIGYTQRLQLYYERPYVNRAQTLGIVANIFYARNREVGYRAQDNILQFYRNDEAFQLQRWQADAGLLYRKQIRARHRLFLQYRDYSITDSVTLRNPDFFLDGATRLRYFGIDYQFIYDYRDFSRYPMEGYYVAASVLKEGLGVWGGINSLYIGASAGRYDQRGRWSWGYGFKVRKALIPQQQPYYNSRALGYEEDFVRGYEYYVIDGQDFAMARAFGRYAFVNRDFDMDKMMPISAFKSLPFRLYAKLYTDHGYVHAPYHSEGNDLTNTYLRSIGTGLDFVFYHDYVMRLEYSLNHRLQHGFYIHYNVSF